MPGLSTEVRIFLSSTFLDLRELRREVSRRFGEIFRAHLITMETLAAMRLLWSMNRLTAVLSWDFLAKVY